MQKHWPELASGLSPALQELRGGAPEVMQAFSQLTRAAMEAPRFSRKGGNSLRSRSQ
jgi:hypothetical protein